jgi:multisubunit Na+/H+ antiporter MnhB subunit
MGPTRRDWLFTAFVALAVVQGLLLLLRRIEAPLPFSVRTFNALRLIALISNVAALAAWTIWGPNEGEDRQARKPPHDP